MALLELPTRDDLPAYNYVSQLDGTPYMLSYFFNPRINDGEGKWFVSLSDQLGNLLVGPVPVVVTWPLFDRFVDAAIPPGTIMAIDTSGQNLDPGQFELGNRVRMAYLEAGS